jgi:hypothetical protein
VDAKCQRHSSTQSRKCQSNSLINILVETKHKPFTCMMDVSKTP